MSKPGSLARTTGFAGFIRSLRYDPGSLMSAADYEDELKFWEEQISGRGQYAASILSRLDLTCQPPEYRWDMEPVILALGEEQGRPSRVLDVGSGPASVFSYGAQRGAYELIAADPLAARYEELLRRYGYAPTSPMVACRGEELSQYLPFDHFDFTWSWNAIDHADDPAEVFRQMISVTRPGGTVAVHVFENEGTAAGWTGLHQHNISSDGEYMVCTTRGRPPIAVRDPRIEPQALSRPLGIVPRVEGRRWLSFVYRKISSEAERARSV